MRLIDADALYSLLSKDGSRFVEIGTETTLDWAAEIQQIKLYIRKAPTIDAVKVVRCGECGHWNPSNARAGNTAEDMQVIGGCEYSKYLRREKDFCSYGERKDK